MKTKFKKVLALICAITCTLMMCSSSVLAADVTYNITTSTTTSTTTASSKAKATKTTTSTTTTNAVKSASISTVLSASGSYAYKYKLRTVTTTKKRYTKGSKKVKVTKKVKKYYSTNMGLLTPAAPRNVRSVYNQLGFNLKINSSTSHAGYSDMKTRSITLKKIQPCVYHEMGHFVAFVADNADKKSDFIAIYNAEKSKYTGYNKNYATSSASEYYASSFQDYCLRPSVLKSTRPKTYQAIVNGINACTSARATTLYNAYKAILG